MEAPKWIGECGNYLGYEDPEPGDWTGGPMLDGEDDMARPNGGGGGYSPPPEPYSPPAPYTPPPTDPYTPPPSEPANGGITYVPDAVITETVEEMFPDWEKEDEVETPVEVDSNGDEYVEYTDPETGKRYQLKVGGAGGQQTVTKQETPKWVVPALIAAATMLLGR